MPQHGRPDLRIERISKHGYEKENDKQQDVQAKDDVGDILQPPTVVGKVVEEDGRDSGTHIDAEPRRSEVSDNTSPAALIFAWFGIASRSAAMAVGR